MSSKWHQKKDKIRLEQEAREEAARPDETIVKDQVGDAAMGKGEDELFEKKMTKEEKKAAAKAAREAKKKAKLKKKGIVAEDKEENGKDAVDADQLLKAAKLTLEDGKESMHSAASEALAEEGTICTFSTSTKGVDPRSRDINIQDFTMLHKGAVMLDETEIVLNHGNRYGLIGRNGCGKSTLMKALGVRAVPIPEGIDIFHLKEEIEASDTVTALEAVMNVDEERVRLEKEVDNLNNALSAIADADDDPQNDSGPSKTMEEQQEEIMDLLSYLYERLDALDADTAEKKSEGNFKRFRLYTSNDGKENWRFFWRMENACKFGEGTFYTTYPFTVR